MMKNVIFIKLLLFVIFLFAVGCVIPNSNSSSKKKDSRNNSIYIENTNTSIPADRITTWNPGVTGGIPNTSSFSIHSTVSLGGNAAANCTNIQNAINAAGDVASEENPQVVQLPSGSYNIAGTIYLDRDYVVLRGAGPDVSGSGTRLIETGIDTDLFFMGNFVGWSDNAFNVSGSISKGASVFSLSSGHDIQTGDLIIIDKLDDSTVSLQGGTWYKRGPIDDGDGPISSGFRSIGQVCLVMNVSGNTITIAGVFHNSYPSSLSPQVFRSTTKRTGYSGIGLENMTITGWGDAFGIYANFLINSWIKNVEFDGQPTAQGGTGTGTLGTDIRIFRSVYFTLEHCYLHHSREYITNNHAYGISLATQTSNTLIQDNIVWFKNKNIVLEASGSGNVIAYNYLEDPVIADTGADIIDWMEMCMDGSHLSHPSMDLFEGNYVSKMGAGETHGNAGKQTYFRNYSRGDRDYPMEPNAGLASVMLNRYMRNMTFAGNVLSTRADGIYEPDFDEDGYMPYEQVDTPKIWSLGLDGYDGNWQGPRDTVVESECVRFANYDTIRNQIDKNPSGSLPSSLYLSSKPAFFGSLYWPWVNPFGSTENERIRTLPAKARFDAGTYF